MQAFRQALDQMITITDEEFDQFSAMCHAQQFPRKALLSDARQSVDEVYFMLKGIVRVVIEDHEGREHTTHFAMEHQFIADYNAFINREKANYRLQALENTSVIVVPRKAIEWGYQHLQDGQKLGRLVAEYYFTYLDTRVQRRYTLSLIERYHLISTTFPGIHDRVPQHMIASYLGITPIHLSRLKKQVNP